MMVLYKSISRVILTNRLVGDLKIEIAGVMPTLVGGLGRWLGRCQGGFMLS